MQKYKLTISDAENKNIYISKEYCCLSKFDFKVNSSVLFLLAAEKDKKKPDKDLINRLKKELKTQLDVITEYSELFKYLNKPTFVKDYYGDKGRIYKLEKL